MAIVYLNGQFLPTEEAKISPMDRGFLFGDGVYEVIPSYEGRMVGFKAHMERLNNGLTELQIELALSVSKIQSLCTDLLKHNGMGNKGIYIQISRGAYKKRYHAYPANIQPTVFMFTFELPSPPSNDLHDVKTAKVITAADKRWQRCHIKSTSLLGNVMHFQQGVDNDANETLLFDQNGYLTEASSSNVFIVNQQGIFTPPLSNALLPGVTRKIVLSILNTQSSFHIKETGIHKNELSDADEIWITSSTKEIMPVVKIDNKEINGGQPGPIWREAQMLYNQFKFDY